MSATRGGELLTGEGHREKASRINRSSWIVGQVFDDDAHGRAAQK